MSEQITTATLVEPPPPGADSYNYKKALKRELGQISPDVRSTYFYLGRGAVRQLIAPGEQSAAVHQSRQDELTLVKLYDEDGENGEGRLFKLYASIGARAANTYKALDDYKRQDLVWGVESAMVDTAMRLRKVAGETDDARERRREHYHHESMSLMNYQPLLFEPFGQSSVQGTWLDQQGRRTRYFDQRKRLILEGHESTSPDQRLVLLGGVASFLSYLDAQNS